MHKLISLIVVLCCVGGAYGVVVAGGDGTQQSTAPIGDQGWSNVGQIIADNGCPSGVTYLDNGWFITAGHIKERDNPSGVLLGGVDYTILDDSWRRITNNTGTGTDLMMFSVAGTVSAPSISITSDTPALGVAVTMIGNGVNREASSVLISDEELYLLESDPANTTKRWGTNTSEGASRISVYSGGEEERFTDSFYTDFDPVYGEAQGALWDSGGGVFVQRGEVWDLAGIMIEAENLYKLGDRMAAMLSGGGDLPESRTYMADLSVYSDQINRMISVDVIPEPSTLAFCVTFGVLICAIRRVLKV